MTIETLVLRAWERVSWPEPEVPDRPRTVHWYPELSPPFPDSWPIQAGAALIYYAFATGFDFSGGLADAAYISAPWGKVRLSPEADEGPALELLSKQLEVAGILAVRPVSPEEVSDVPPDPGWLERTLPRAAKNAELGGRVQTYYRGWLQAHPTLKEFISQAHPDFVQWAEHAA